MRKVIKVLRARLPLLEAFSRICTTHGIGEEEGLFFTDSSNNGSLFFCEEIFRAGFKLDVNLDYDSGETDNQEFMIALKRQDPVAQLIFTPQDGWKYHPSFENLFPMSDEVRERLQELDASLGKLDFSGEHADLVANEAMNMIVGFFAKLPNDPAKTAA